MTVLAYKKNRMLGIPKAEWRMRTLAQDNNQLLGQYYYLATWADGNEDEGFIEVNNESPLTFRPRRR
jgi:hypothetical protein